MRASLLNPVRIYRPAAAAALVVALAAAGCSSGHGSDAATTSTTRAPATSTTAAQNDEAAVLDGYRGYWSAYLHASDPMNPEDPQLRQYATGAALETVVKAFVALKSAGKVIRGQFDLAPRVVTVDGQAATVRDCYGDDTGVYDAWTGARNDKPTGQRHLVTATMRLEGGGWKVERLADEGLGCTAG